MATEKSKQDTRCIQAFTGSCVMARVRMATMCLEITLVNDLEVIQINNESTIFHRIVMKDHDGIIQL